MWVASWNKKHGTETEESGKTGKTLFANGNNDDTNKTGYYVGDKKDCSSTYYNLSSCGGYSDPLYFPHHKNENLNLFDGSDNYSGDSGGNVTCYGYWLASPSAYSSYCVMYVICSGSVYYSIYYYGYGVRPVVSLKSDVKVEWRTDGDTGYYEIVGNN